MSERKALSKILKEPYYLSKVCGYNKLVPLHGEWIKWLLGKENSEKEEDKEKLLLAHRGSYKTTCIVVGLVWLLLHDCEQTILLVRKTATRSVSVLRAVSKQLQNPLVKRLFELKYGVKFKMVKNTDYNIELGYKKNITIEPNIMGCGIGDSVTGLHFSRIHNDDVVTTVDKKSSAERRRTIDFCDECTNLLNPGGTSTYTGTAWHEEDAYSRIKNLKRYPIGSMDLAEYTEKKIQSLKDKLPLELYILNYELEIVNVENSRFSDMVLGEMPEDYKTCYAQIDAGYKGADNTAMTILIKQEKDGVIRHHVRGYRLTGHVLEHETRILQIIRKFRVNHLYLEDNADKGLLADTLRKSTASLGYVRIISYHESMKKEIKINNYLGLYWDCLVFSNSSDSKYLLEIKNYGDIERDDCPDSLATLLCKVGSKGFIKTKNDYSNIRSNYEFNF